MDGRLLARARVEFRQIDEFSGRNVAYDGAGAVVDEVEEASGNVVANFFRNAFLPEGYPGSVSRDYLEYQMWDTVQAFASTISGTLATQAVLEGVGVGNEAATPLAATLTWLWRHGAGMAGQVLFTWLRGSDLDNNCKKWRLFADFANDLAMCLELSGPLWHPACLNGVLCTAGIARAVVGVAGGATRTAITQHQARENNISDVAAKDGSQETMVNLLGLLVNLAILPWAAANRLASWLLFFALTSVHLFANYMAVKCLVIETLNEGRLSVVLREMATNSAAALSPEVANARESVFPAFFSRKRRRREIVLGAKLPPGEIVSRAKKSLRADKFFVFESGEQTNVALAAGISPEEVVKAYCAAFFAAKSEKISGEKLLAALRDAGWRTDVAQIPTRGWRGEFSPKVD